jgi:hypothetical protein
MAKTIPADEQVFMVSKSTNTTYSGSAALKAMNEWYTMEDVANTVQPYKVFTGLLTQSGGDNSDSKTDGLTTIGVSYTITNYLEGDFTIIGAPNNNIGTKFIATGTTPDWGSTEGSQLDFNTGAPVVTVLENTIGDIWFTYIDIGQYGIFSNALFQTGKTTLSINLMGDDTSSGYVCLGNIEGTSGLRIYTGNLSDNYDSVLIVTTPIEIRVYN